MAQSQRTTFYLILLTQTFSLIGTRMTAIGLGIWLFAETGNTAPLLLMAFFNELPGVLAGSVAGVLVDRWNRRRVMLLADLGQAGGTLLLLALFALDHFTVWSLYLIVFGQGVFAILQGPASQAATTMLIPEAERDRANGLKEMAFPLAGVVAPVFAGIVYAGGGLVAVIGVDLLTFLVAATLLALVTIPQPQTTAEGGAVRGTFGHELMGGLRFFTRRPPLLLMLLYLTLINYLLNGPLELAIPYLLTVTGDETQMGLLLGVMSLGAFAGAGLVALRSGRRRRIPLLLGGMALSGMMFLVYGVARQPLLLALSLFLLMVPLPMSGALFASVLQQKTPPAMQGRAFAVYGQLGFAGATLSFLTTGPLVDRVLEPAVGSTGWQWVAPLVGNGPGAGIGLLLFGVGVVILVATGLMLLLPVVRGLELNLPDYAPVVTGPATEVPLAQSPAGHGSLPKQSMLQ